LKKLLIAEDEQDIFDLIKAILAVSLNYKFFEARDGSQAVSVACLVIPDIILLDFQLPGMDGHQVCSAVRKNPALSHTRILMLSSMSFNYDSKWAGPFGADAYLAKPFSPADLIREIDQLLARP
jgi:two-component system, cell cycle response regulator DivK